MPFSIYNQALVGSLVLLASCYNSHNMEVSRDFDSDFRSEDRRDQPVDAGGYFDTTDSFDANSPHDKEVDTSTLVGTWEGELMFYGSDGTLNGVTPVTVEFTDTGIEVSVVGAFIEFRYSVDTGHTPSYLNIELFDPQRTLPSSYVIPAFYKIDNDTLTLGISFFSARLGTVDVEEEYYPMVFEMVRVP